jgi:Holliday junction resolvase RusA-like endonuclease
MSEFNVEDFMVVTDPTGSQVSFVMVGDLPTQQRHRVNFWQAPMVAGRNGPHTWDPSSKEKQDYTSQVRTAMVDYGCAHPYFDIDHPITLEVVFVLPRQKQDWVRQNGVAILTPKAQTFPKGKDVDNMLKFVMDVLQDVLYANDTTITKVTITKMFPQQADARGWTILDFSTNSQAFPPLARGVWA